VPIWRLSARILVSGCLQCREQALLLQFLLAARQLSRHLLRLVQHMPMLAIGGGGQIRDIHLAVVSQARKVAVSAGRCL